MSDLTHLPLIEEAVRACMNRGFYAHFPEHPKAYGEEAPALGEAQFGQMLGRPFELQQEEENGRSGEESSPYTRKALGILYPTFTPEKLVSRAKAAQPAWASTSFRNRADLLVESLDRMKDLFFLIAHATMHTTGQAFLMSFQASGPHAADRALEAIAMGYHQLGMFPSRVSWEKPMGKSSIRLEKTFIPVPRGVSLAIGCSTFPVWNTLPGLYASLVTGNPVIVKPHPTAVLPIALVVREIRKTLLEHGHHPDICQLAVDTRDQPITKSLCEHPDVKLIDFTGSSAFGAYVESLPGKTTFTEKAGVNAVILDSVEDPAPVFQNLAFSLSLYSGQMCTAPQNIFVPETGIPSSLGQIRYEEILTMLLQAVKDLALHPKMGAGTLGAIQNQATVDRAEKAREEGKALTEEIRIVNPDFPDARTLSLVVLEVGATDRKLFEKEWFGPVALVVKTRDTDESLDLSRKLAERHGAITCAAYSRDLDTILAIGETMNEVFTPVSFNFTGPVWINQHAAFSDFHVTGGNPSGNASITDPEFIDKRFVWVGNRYMGTPSA
ncbi:MAG TPA: phenylacetic acid degradation protein PaaN [Chitinophagaceae bacterium]|nr:phenylacetic acid degradation protein PaaN [Chitinophagaceae bacterium]